MAKHPQLILFIDGNAIRVALDRPTTSLGSDPSCAIALEGQGLEPFHAVIQREGPHHEIFSLAGPQALRVNGKEVEATALRPGDRIEAGRLKATFLAPSPPPSSEIIPFAEQPPPPPEPSADRSESPVEEPEEKTAEGNPGGGFLSRILALLSRRPGRGPSKETGEEDAAAPAETVAPDEWMRQHHRFRRDQESFSDELILALKRTPWILLSAILHITLLIILDLLSTQVPRPRELLPVDSGLTADGEEVIEEPFEEDGRDEEVEVAEVTADAPDEDLNPPETPEELVQEEPEEADDSPVPPDAPFVVGTDAGGDIEGALRGTGRGLKGTSRNFRKYVRRLRASGLDIVFVVDSTGSMGEVLQDARERVTHMITVLAQVVRGFRLGLVTYRDRGDAWLTRSVELTPYRYKVVHLLDDLRAEGGGDQPEDMLAGLRKALDMDWSRKARKILIVIADAPPHQKDVDRVRSLASSFASRGGVIHTIFTPTEDGAGERGATWRFMRDLARLGRGSFVQLSQNDRILPRILEVAFGERNRKDMQALVSRIEKGQEGARMRKLLATADARDVRGLLTGRPLKEALVQELAAHDHREYLPAYLEVVLDRTASMDSRWAAAVLLRRLILETSSSAELLELAGSIRPDVRRSRLQKTAATFRRRAALAGYPMRMRR